MEVSFLFIHCMTNSFTFLNMQRFTFFYPQSYPQSNPHSLHQRKVFLVNLPLVNHFPLPRHFFPIYFSTNSLQDLQGCYQFHCLAINESTVPNANVYFDCFRTWGNMFGIGASLFFLHNLYVSYCIYCDIII